MKYMGSKRRIAKFILPIILKDRTTEQWYVEPFVGGANTIDKVEGPRIGFDINEYLIAILNELKAGWIPFDTLTREQYNHIKDNRNKVEKFIVGYVGFPCSFGSKWFGGYCKPNKHHSDYIGEAKRNVLKQAPLIKDCHFKVKSYNEITFPKKCIIYCDPPYQGTTKYKDGDFDHPKFWQWCREKVSEGHKVFISEYNAPDDFKCIWEKEQTTTVSKQDYKKATERLFIYSPND